MLIAARYGKPAVYCLLRYRPDHHAFWIGIGSDARRRSAPIRSSAYHGAQISASTRCFVVTKRDDVSLQAIRAESDFLKGRRTLKRSRFAEEQIIAILQEPEARAKAADVYRRNGISNAAFLQLEGQSWRLEVWTRQATAIGRCAARGLRAHARHQPPRWVQIR